MSNPVAIKKINYTHDGMIDLIIAQPAISQNELGFHFGYTPAWVSQVMSSDAFKERLAARKQELVDPQIMMSLDEKFTALAHSAMDKLQQDVSIDMMPQKGLVKILEVTARALGYGAKDPKAGLTVNNYVAVCPPKAASSREWATTYTPEGQLCSEPSQS